MANTSGNSDSLTSSSPTTVSKDLPHQFAEATKAFLVDHGIRSSPLSDTYNSNDSYSDCFLRHLLKTITVQRGRISCVFTVFPAVANMYNGLFGGAIGAITERVAIACVRTVVAEDKQIFLGELSISYLSSARQNEVVLVDGSVVKSGRNLTAVKIEYRIKESLKLMYAARATFYHLPISKL